MASWCYLCKHTGDHSVTTEACSSPNLTCLGLCAMAVWKLNGAICTMQSNTEVAWSCTCPYSNAKDGFVVVPNGICHLPRLRSYQYENISVTIVQVSMYDIMVSLIFCCMYFYAHKSWLSYRDFIGPLIRSVDYDVSGPLWCHQKAVSCIGWDKSLSHTPHCFEGVRIMFVNCPWAIQVW